MKSSANGRYLLSFFILGYALPWRGDNIPLFRYYDRSRYIIVFNELPNFSISGDFMVLRAFSACHFDLYDRQTRFNRNNAIISFAKYSVWNPEEIVQRGINLL